MKIKSKIENRRYKRELFKKRKQGNKEYNFELKLEEALNSYKAAHYQEAVEKLKYLEINNNQFLVNWYLGHAYFKLFEYNLAIQSIKKSIQLKSKDVLNLNFLAELYKAINKYDLAILSLEESLKIDEKNKNTLINLAEVYTDKGNFEKAENYYLLVLDLEKNNYSIIYKLIKLKKKYLNQELVDNIKNNLRNINNTEEKIYANLILAQNENNKKEFKNEIKILNGAHSLYQNKKKIAAGEEWNYYTNLLPQFIKKCEKVEINIQNQLEPIFILGMPRSGTTLIENIITSGKEQIVTGGETNALDSIFFSKKLIGSVKSQILSTDFNFEVKDFELLSKNLIDHYDQLRLVNVHKSNTFIDKSITNFLYIEIIKKIFPKAKFVYCSRNPFANILGIYKVFLPHLFWSHSIEKIFMYYNLHVEKLNTEINKKNPNFKVISLEQLTNEPKKTSIDLFEFLDLEWTEDCINLKNNNIIKTASNIQVRKSIKKHNLDYLKNYYDIFKNIGENYDWFKS